MGFKSGVGGDPSEQQEQRRRREEPETNIEREPSGNGSSSGRSEQPYVIRRMMKSESAQFERGTRLNFFVHDDIEQGEKQLLTELDEEYDLDLTKLDLREAVYRAALANADDVRAELEKMGYPRKE